MITAILAFGPPTMQGFRARVAGGSLPGIQRFPATSLQTAAQVAFPQVIQFEFSCPPSPARLQLVDQMLQSALVARLAPKTTARFVPV